MANKKTLQLKWEM